MKWSVSGTPLSRGGHGMVIVPRGQPRQPAILSTYSLNTAIITITRTGTHHALEVDADVSPLALGIDPRYLTEPDDQAVAQIDHVEPTPQENPTQDRLRLLSLTQEKV